MNFRELINKINEADTAGLDPATAAPGAAPAPAVDPAKQHAYRRAQAAMANLEAGAQYSGTDEIVRSRYGLPPPLPPIEQWDGKMPQPVGEPDWMTRNIFGRGADEKIKAGAAQNAADVSSIDTAHEKLKQLNDIIAKLGTPAPVKEGIHVNIATQLVESFGYTLSEDAEVYDRAGNYIPGTGTPDTRMPAMRTPGAGAGTKAIGNASTKALGGPAGAAAAGAVGAAAKGGVGSALKKALPGVGLAYGAYDAYNRAQKGDYTGAAMAGASGLASMVPGWGTAAALGLDAANLARDYNKGTPAGAKKGTTAPNPDVLKIQKDLIAKGAKIKADGIMGPKTQAAMKEFGAAEIAPTPAAPTIAPETKAQIDQLMSDLSQYNDPEIQQGLATARAALQKAGAI